MKFGETLSAPRSLKMSYWSMSWLKPPIAEPMTTPTRSGE
jgi:hypothetical protein